jgi:hypothetical protein
MADQEFIGDKPVFSFCKGNSLLMEAVEKGKPFCFGRAGATEMMVLDNYLRQRGMGNWDKSLSVDWSSSYILNVPIGLQARYMGGLYPPEENILNRFCDYYIDCMKEVDLYGTWVNRYAEKEIVCDHYNGPLVEGGCYQSFDNHIHCEEEPWTMALSGKKILVAHPFSQSIQNQKSKLQEIWPREQIFPEDIEIDTIKIPLYDYLIEPDHKDWFDALDWMKTEMENKEFDVLFVGAGFWGVPLSVHAKKIGRIGIHSAGATQLFFGIRGARWDDNPRYAAYVNEHWVRPLPEETPDSKFDQHKAVFHEGGCYW